MAHILRSLLVLEEAVQLIHEIGRVNSLVQQSVLNVDRVLGRVDGRLLEVHVGLREDWRILDHLLVLETDMLMLDAPILIEHFLLTKKKHCYFQFFRGPILTYLDLRWLRFGAATVH